MASTAVTSRWLTAKHRVGGAGRSWRASRWSASSSPTDPASRLGARWQERSDRGFGVDTAYVAAVRVVLTLARLVVVLDRDVVDAYPRGAARVAGLLGRAGERTHRGVPSAGLVALVVGVVGLAVAGVTVWH